MSAAGSGVRAQADLERARDRAFRRMPARRVRNARDALAFVEEVGICSTFYRFPDGLACLWEAVVGRRDPRWPRRSHHDAGISLTWELRGHVAGPAPGVYGKLLKGRPVLVALDVFPAFYALVRGRQRARDYRAEYEAGRLSHAAKRLMDVVIRRHPLYTREWRAEALMLDPGSTRGFERAVAELQQGLFVVKSEERYDPSFSYRWDLVEGWLPEGVREGRRLGRPRRRSAASSPGTSGAPPGAPCAGWLASSGCRPTRCRRRWRRSRERETSGPGWPSRDSPASASSTGASARAGPDSMEPPAGFRYVDAHTHLHPPGLFAAIRRWFAEHTDWNLQGPSEPDEIVAALRGAGIERFAFFSTPTGRGWPGI